MSNVLLSRGIVAFLDILGYENLLTRNPLNAAARLVIDRIEDLEPKTMEQFAPILEELQRIAPEEVRDEFSRALERVDWTIFSDTVVLTAAYEEGAESESNWVLWYAFLAVSSILYSGMLQEGLPLRGAISFGDFLPRQENQWAYMGSGSLPSV